MTKDNDDGAGDGAQNDDGAGDGSSSSSSAPTVAEQITAATKAAVGDVLGALGISDKDTNDDGANGDGVKDDKGTAAPPATSARATEASVAAEVERQMARVRADEKRDAELADVRAKVETIAEKAPRKLRPITRAIWGSDE